MSRKSSRRRGTNATSNQRLPFSHSSFRVPSSPRPWGSSPLSVFEDRRSWHPQGSSAPARSFSTTRHRLTVVDRVPRRASVPRFHSPTFGLQTKAVVAFSQPSRVLICVRRKIRREVMHALRFAGKTGQRKPHYSEYSRVRC